ncbi:hypothetical protein EHQ76_15165 [Leptospira barantonii]|uniref:Uncharacterized protein n=1 Tax=Leptospira barantonii TaxID=2023184 RepID=A0A5F2B050_9LEPT|nr:hypothetical protein EHQ76_15165 [Leptospira barantonii]
MADLSQSRFDRKRILRFYCKRIFEFALSCGYEGERGRGNGKNSPFLLGRNLGRITKRLGRSRSQKRARLENKNGLQFGERVVYRNQKRI